MTHSWVKHKNIYLVKCLSGFVYNRCQWGPMMFVTNVFQNIFSVLHKKVIKVLNAIRVIKWWKKCHFGVNYLFKLYCTPLSKTMKLRVCLYFASTAACTQTFMKVCAKSEIWFISRCPKDLVFVIEIHWIWNVYIKGLTVCFKIGVKF